MTKEFKKGEVLFKEGDVGETCFDVVSGRVGIYTDFGTDVEKQLTTIEAGHILGELALVDALPRSATAVAISDVTVNEFNFDDLQRYFEEDTDKITFIIKEMSERISRLTGDYDDVVDTIGELFPANETRKPGITDTDKTPDAGVPEPGGPAHEKLAEIEHTVLFQRVIREDDLSGGDGERRGDEYLKRDEDQIYGEARHGAEYGRERRDTETERVGNDEPQTERADIGDCQTAEGARDRRRLEAG